MAGAFAFRYFSERGGDRLLEPPCTSLGARCREIALAEHRARRGGQQLGDEWRGFEPVLEVVENQKQALIAQRGFSSSCAVSTARP
jgi:hypothetical protein